MKLSLTAAAATALCLATAGTADAQVNRNKIVNSGNGINNSIVVRNGPRHPGYYPQQHHWDGGYGQNFGAGYGYGGGGFAPNFGVGQQFGGFNPTGFAPGGCYPGFPGRGFGGGVNVNVVTNSGNGIGNTIKAGNGNGPGWLNINVITNSGNGQGNFVGVRNR